MGTRRGNVKKVSGVVLSLTDETSLSWRDCYVPDFFRIASVACESMFVLL